MAGFASVHYSIASKIKRSAVNFLKILQSHRVRQSSYDSEF